MAKIKYGEKTMAEITTGQSITLHTAGQEMEHDIEIEGFASGEGGSGESTDCMVYSAVLSPTKTVCNVTNLHNLRLELRSATSIGYGAFSGCSGLIEIYLPKVTTIDEHGLSECSTLSKVNLPLVESIGINAFSKCSKLQFIDAPNVKSIDSNAFYQCWALTRIDLPNATSIGEGAFLECALLATLILRNTETMCNLDLTAILRTKIATAEGMPTGEGFIYVPTALYEDYVANFTEQATALLVSTGMTEEEAVVMAEQMSRAVLRKIEDYPEICG